MREIEKVIEKFRLASWKHGREAQYGGQLLFENRDKVNTAYCELVQLIKDAILTSATHSNTNYGGNPDNSPRKDVDIFHAPDVGDIGF